MRPVRQVDRHRRLDPYQDIATKTEHRLRRGVDFERVRANRKSWSHPFLVCYACARGDDSPTRLGIIVGRRVGKATIRNRIKRRIREVVRAAYPRLQPGYDVVLIARPAAVEASVPDLAAAFAALLERARLRRPAASTDDTQARGGNATAAESGGQALGIQEPLRQ